MKKLKLFFACLLMAVLSIGQVWAVDYELVTSTSQLVAGAHYVIGAPYNSNNSFMATTENNNNRKITNATVSNNKVTATESMMTFTLGGSTDAWTFATDNYAGTAGYLNATSTTGSNNLKVVASLDNYAYFTIAITSEGVATITCNGKTSRHIMYLNGTTCISCYNSQTGAQYVKPRLYKEVTAGCQSEVTVTKGSETNGTYTLSAAKVCADGDGGEITISNITPATGYEFDEITTSTSGTVDNELKKVTGIKAATTITVTFKALPKYTVSFNVGGSAASQSPIEEASAGVGITLPAGPAPTCSAAGWEFAGWAAAAVASQTTTAPTLLSAGDTYHPTSNCTLYAVYKKGEGTAETWNPITSAPDDWSGDYVLENSGYAMTSDFNVSGEFAGAAVTITDGKVVSPTDKMIWTFAKNGENAQYSLKNKSTGTYANITGTSSKNAGLSESAVWFTLSYSSSNVWQINSVTNSTRCFAYYQNNFRTYANSTASNGVNLYKKSGGATYYYLSNPTCTPPAVADPVISLAEGEYEGTQSVTITCETTGAAIYYTTDGSDPTSGSTLYGSAISVSASQTIKAIAIKDEAESNIVSAEYTIVTTCETPTFSLAEGSYEGTQSVEISCARAGVAIYYTIDGTDPTTASTLYGSAISVSASQTIKAIATKTGLTNSAIASASYTIIAGPDVTIAFEGNTNWDIPEGSGSKTVDEGTYTDGTYTIKIAGSTGAGYYINGYLLLGKTGAYVELPEFSDPVEKIIVVGTSGGSEGVKFNIYDGTTAASAEKTGCKNVSQEFTITNPAANKVYKVQVTSNANLQISAIKIYFGEAPAVAQPTISGETPFLNSTNVTISIPDGATVYYTTDGSTPTDASTEYSVPFALNNSATVKAIAKIGSDYSFVAEKAFTKATVMTVAQARAAIDAGGDLTNKFVAGTISQIDSYQSNYHSITYWISDDGTTTDQLEVYSGLAGVVKAQFESVNDLAVGDDVTVKGTLKKYNSTYEFDYNNTIEAYKPIARLAWSAESFDAALEGENTFPSLTNTNGVTVSYSSSDPTKASFADASVYAITLNAAGSTTITATFAGNETYKANSASYTLNIASSLVTLTYNVDGGEAIDPANVSALPNPLPTTTKAGFNFGGWFTDPEKTVDAVAGAAITENTTLYAKWLDPYTVAEAKTVIDANPDGIANQYVTGVISQIDSYNNTYHSITYWISADGATTNQLQVYGGLIGNAATALGKEQFTAKTDLELGDEVVVTGTLKLHNSTTYEFDKNNTIYTFSRKASAGLEYAVTAVNKVVGDADFVNELTNPISVAVTYATSDDQVAEVASDGTVTIIGEGTATISATFEGNEDYKPAVVSYTITVNAASPVLTDYYQKVTETAGIVEGTYLIVYEEGSLAFNGGLETLDAKNNVIDVEITNDNKIGVTTATEAATFYIEPAAGTIQAANGKYIGVTSNSNGLKQSDNADAYENAFAIDADGNAVISAVFENASMTMRYNKASDQNRFRYFGSSQQPIALYKLANETIKDNPNLTWSGDVEITVGGEFASPTLTHAAGITGTITYTSDKETVATVNEFGVISLVADATGTAHITASYAGDENFKSGEAVCTIKVNPANSIYVSPSLNVNFGSVAKDATVDDKVITVTLTGVDAATATLGGTNPEAFSISPAALTASGDITISVASTATAGEYSAKLTISDDAGVAESKVVNISLTVTDPAAAETPISTSSKWVAATAADLVDGAEVIITGVKDEVVYAMGEQKSTNRAAYAATVDGEGVLTPGEGTMAFTLEAKDGGTFALRTSDGKFLYAAASGSNHLKTQAEVDENAKWTLSVTSAVAEGSSNRNVMQFNGSSATNKLFSCYATASQSAIQLYVPKPVTPEPPVVDYTEVRNGLTVGWYYTMCLDKAVTAVKAGSIWRVLSKAANGNDVILEEAELPLEAGRPYIFRAAESTLEVAYTGDAVLAPVNDDENNGLIGSFSKASIAQSLNNYIIYDNELYYVNSDNVYVGANRAYLDMTGVPDYTPSTPAPGRLRMVMKVNGKGSPQGFESIEASEKPMKLMINGQMYILRGEKMYDATGRLVK